MRNIADFLEGTVMSSLPVWTGNEHFIAAMDQMVREPFERPETFHSHVVPLRGMVAIYGRPGVAEAARAYCNAIRLTPVEIDVEIWSNISRNESY